MAIAKHPELPKGCYQLFYQYRLRCSKRDVSWSLTLKQFHRLTTADCVYCGRAPGQQWQPGMYLYNGIDRLDGNKGYTRLNSVTACGECNGLKSNRFTPEETRIMAQALLRFRQGR